MAISERPNRIVELKNAITEIAKLEAEKRFIDKIDPMKLCRWEQGKRRQCENQLIDLYARKARLKHCGFNYPEKIVRD